jgi:hypothetical protein
VTSGGLASVLAHGMWNLEWHFHTRTMHIPFLGSILKHMCYQLAEEAGKGQNNAGEMMGKEGWESQKKKKASGNKHHGTPMNSANTPNNNFCLFISNSFSM